MITDLDTGMASTLHNTSWIDKGFDPLDMAVPAPPVVRRRRSKPPLHPINDTTKQKTAPQKEATKMSTASRMRRRNSRRARNHLHRAAGDALLGFGVKVDVQRKKKERDFALLVRIQEIKAHNGAVRAMAFSQDGKYLATAGQDAVVNVYVVGNSGKSKVEEKTLDAALSTSTPSSSDSRETADSDSSPSISNGTGTSTPVSTVDDDKEHHPKSHEYLVTSPLRRYHGHTQDVVDLDWSKNGFLLSASMDMTVMLWHPDSSLCLRKFVHNSFVTCVAFHPKDENIFISGSLDGLVRLWHVTDQKLLSLTQTGQFVTAAAINDDGKTALIGTYHGHCKFYSLYDEIASEWSLKYTTQLDVRSRKAKNNTGKKIAGFTFLPKGDKFVVSSNDSRLRTYRMDDKAVIAKFAGHSNESSQLKGSISPCGKYLLCGSQDSSVVIWDMTNTKNGGSPGDLSDSTCDDKSTPSSHNHGHKERNTSYEKFIPFEQNQVTAALFAPRRAAARDAGLFADTIGQKNHHSSAAGSIMVAASEKGFLRIFQNGVR